LRTVDVNGIAGELVGGFVGPWQQFARCLETTGGDDIRQHQQNCLNVK
jgi:hypothetical protein